MIPDKIWIALNLSMGFVIFLLLLNFAGVKLPTIGQAQYYLDKTEPICIVNAGDEYTQWGDLDQCCLEARQQLSCSHKTVASNGLETDWSCSSNGYVNYLLNKKAYNYCRQSEIW